MVITGAVLLLIWLLLAGVIIWKKPALLEKARTEIQDRTGGDASIGDMDLSFFRHFPYFTLHLSKVTLHDSLWQQHHHDLLKAESIDLRVDLPGSLLAGKLQVGKVFLEQGSVYLFTDSSGYTNTDMLRRGKPAGSGKEMKLPDFSLKDIRFVMEKQDKRTLFDLDIHRLTGTVEQHGRTLFLDLGTDIKVNSLAFNTEKGSFLRETSVSGHFRLQFNSGSKILQVNRQALLIDGHPFLVSGRFFPDVSPDPFLLTIETTAIPYRKATALLTPLLQQKLDQYDIDKPISLNATIDAGSADDHTPQINVRMSLSKGSVSTPVGRFTAASFDGSFTNEWAHGHKREDENSGIRLLSFSGAWSEIPLKADTITITNLKRPLLATTLHSKFELTKLNDLIGSKSIQFRKGMGGLNINYKGPLSGNDSTRAAANGSLDIDSAAISYQPYRFLLTDCKGKIRFSNQDLIIDHLEAHAGSSKVLVKGFARNLLSLLDKEPENVSMDWSLHSPRLDLRDFTAVLGKPVEPAMSYKAGGPDKNVFGSSGYRLDHLLRDGDIHLQLEAADLLYKNFSGAHAKAELLFSGNEIRLTHMEVEQADLPALFSIFSNSDQQALRDKNMKGKGKADIRMTGLLSDQADTLTIHRMEIQSTDFTLFAEGIYDLKTGDGSKLKIGRDLFEAPLRKAPRAKAHPAHRPTR